MILAKNVLQVIDEAFNNDLNPYMAFITCIWGKKTFQRSFLYAVRLVFALINQDPYSWKPGRGETSDLHMNGM